MTLIKCFSDYNIILGVHRLKICTSLVRTKLCAGIVVQLINSLIYVVYGIRCTCDAMCVWLLWTGCWPDKIFIIVQWLGVSDSFTGDDRTKMIESCNLIPIPEAFTVSFLFIEPRDYFKVMGKNIYLLFQSSTHPKVKKRIAETRHNHCYM